MGGSVCPERREPCHVRKVNAVCIAVLMLLLLILQFNPFRHYGEPEESVSIQSFIWFPGRYSGLETYIREATGDPEFSAGKMVTLPVLELLFCALGIILSCIKGKSSAVPMLSFCAGLTGIIGYLSGGVFRLGSNWGLHSMWSRKLHRPWKT